MANTIICGMDAHDNTLSNRIGMDRETPETKTVKNTQDGRQKLIQHLKAIAHKNEEARIIIAYEASPLGFGIYELRRTGRKSMMSGMRRGSLSC